MNAPDKLPPETRQPVSGYLWGALAVLTCPCHLPILAAVLAGTTAGAFLGEHWGVAALALTGGNDSNLLIVFYVQIMPDDFVMQLHRF